MADADRPPPGQAGFYRSQAAWARDQAARAREPRLRQAWLDVAADFESQAQGAAAARLPPPLRGYRVFRDRGRWCAVGPGFRGLVRSPHGFGRSPAEAVAALGRQLLVDPPPLSAFEIRAQPPWSTRASDTGQPDDARQGELFDEEPRRRRR